MKTPKSINNLIDNVSTFNKKNESMCINGKESYMNPIRAYLKNKAFFKDKKEVKKIKK